MDDSAGLLVTPLPDDPTPASHTDLVVEQTPLVIASVAADQAAARHVFQQFKIGTAQHMLRRQLR